MIGWFGDFFRFWWALFYWNARKTWFRLHGAHRDSCPCQNFSDSGHALDSRCSAVMHWHRPDRFRRVCPLLTKTPAGWRCRVDAERVRPFWLRASAYCGAALLALYLAGTLAVFGFLKSARYEISYGDVVWPSGWARLHAAQERLYATRAQQALAAGSFREAMLALQRVCELNPRNYPAALTLARLAQVSGQPTIADHIYERLMREVPEKRTATAEIWIRPLLARAEYASIKNLAAAMLTENAGHREAWLQCLLYASRRTRDEAFLSGIISTHTSLPDWCLDLVRIELYLTQNRREQALKLLNRINRQATGSYQPYYQADRLIGLRLYEQADALIKAYGDLLPEDEASLLRARIFQAKQETALLEHEQTLLLGYPLTSRLAAHFSAWCIRQPDPLTCPGYLDRMLQAGPAISDETLPLFNAAYLAAVLNREEARAEKLAALISEFTAADAKPLRALGNYLRTGVNAPQVAQLLPVVPLPLDAVYALLERPAGPLKK